jgi:hypothetical protein
MRSDKMAASDRDFLVLMERWADAVARRDSAVLDAIWDPDYRYTSPDGVRMTRDQIMAVEMDVPPPGPFHDVAVQRLDENFAIVRGGHPLKGEFPGGHVRPELAQQIGQGVEIAFTSVWRKRDGSWKVVSNDAHIVR